MDKMKKKIVAFSALLLIATTNFIRLKGNEVIRPIQYFSLLAIGALIALLFNSIAEIISTKRS